MGNLWKHIKVFNRIKSDTVHDSNYVTGQKIGNKRGMHVKQIPEKYNTVEAVRTTMTPTASRINLPEDATECLVFHKDRTQDLFFGDTTSITTTSSDSAPLSYGDVLHIELDDGNENDLYGIILSGSLTVYAIGVYKNG